MKLRARRIALLTVAAGCLVVAGLVVAHWGTVRDFMRDHIEVWQFVCRTETKEVSPESGSAGDMPFLLSVLAGEGDRPVVYDPVAWGDADTLLIKTLPWEAWESVSKLRQNGYRIVEQRFPRRAYVVVGYPPGPDGRARTAGARTALRRSCGLRIRTPETNQSAAELGQGKRWGQVLSSWVDK